MKSLVKRIKSYIPPPLKSLLRTIIYNKYIFPGWHRKAVGGMWEEIGRLQFDFLLKEGLKPEHYFLDVGCGSLRGGAHFIAYLKPGHYFGIDKDKRLLEAGKDIELKRYKIENKNSHLLKMDDFAFESLNQKFDYALAQSLFTHLPLNSIIRCIVNVDKVLVKGGRFYATFVENPKGKSNLEPIRHQDGAMTYFDKDVFHYDFKTFEWICEGTKLKVEYIGSWNHPRNQMMMVFTKI